MRCNPEEEAFIAAEEERLQERALLHRIMALIVDRETIESKTVRDRGNEIYLDPAPLTPWDIRILTLAERRRDISELDKLRNFRAKELKRQSRRMSECGRIVPPRTRPRRPSVKPKLDTWLGRRRSRARASTLVRRSSEGGALRGSMLVQRGSVSIDHRRESIRRASVRRKTMMDIKAAVELVKQAELEMANDISDPFAS